MPQYDYNISKVIQESIKRRPSIELSPTLQKPVYIVTKNMNGHHILELVDALDKEKIQYQLQQETSTLGFALNQRFFVIVDNRNGQVTLGPDFASSLMTIVGYPRVGRNKKNRYCERPEGVIKYYNEFKNTPDTIKMSKSLIKINQPAAEQNGSQVRSKIEVRSIVKYKSQDQKSSVNSHNSLKEACKKESQRIKMIVLQDKSDFEYLSLCQYLFANEKGQQILQKAESMEEIRKKTLLHTNKIKIFYLTNYKQSKELIGSIFIGQVVIFSTEKGSKLVDMIAEPKIYAIAYRKQELFKIIHKLGIQIDPLVSTFNSTFNQASTYNDSKNSPFLLKNDSNLKKEQSKPVIKQSAHAKPSNPTQMSKIDQNVSIISEKNEASELNASTISKGSSGNRKIKKLGKSKLKENSEAKEQSKQSKIIIKISSAGESQIDRKKTLKSIKSIKSIKNLDYYQNTSKSKKNLTFKENLIETDRVKRIKSIPKVGPEVYNIDAKCQATVTENQYYTINPSNQSSSQSRGVFFNRSRNSFLESGKVPKNGLINGLFYRQFVPKFDNMAQIIKKNPSLLFANNEKQAHVQSFVYVKQYDRFVRRLKNRLRELKQQNEQYNFVVLLRDEDFLQFQDYCRAKSQIYDEEDNEFASTLKENFSSLNKTTTKMNLYVFIESQKEVKSELISFGKIDIFKNQLIKDASDINLSKTVYHLREKVGESSHLMNRDYLCA